MREAEDAMKVTEAYCDSIVMYEDEQTLTSHGLDNIQNNKSMVVVGGGGCYGAKTR